MENPNSWADLLMFMMFMMAILWTMLLFFVAIHLVFDKDILSKMFERRKEDWYIAPDKEDIK
jgi:hypothetical protein